MSEAALFSSPPEVPITAFKANPIAYADTGAIVLVHNRPRMRVVPIHPGDPVLIDDVKARLRVLNALVDEEAAVLERAELARERRQDLLDEAR